MMEPVRVVRWVKQRSVGEVITDRIAVAVTAESEPRLHLTGRRCRGRRWGLLVQCVTKNARHQYQLLKNISNQFRWCWIDSLESPTKMHCNLPSISRTSLLCFFRILRGKEGKGKGGAMSSITEILQLTARNSSLYHHVYIFSSRPVAWFIMLDKAIFKTFEHFHSNMTICSPGLIQSRVLPDDWHIYTFNISICEIIKVTRSFH